MIIYCDCSFVVDDVGVLHVGSVGGVGVVVVAGIFVNSFSFLYFVVADMFFRLGKGVPAHPRRKT